MMFRSVPVFARAFLFSLIAFVFALGLCGCNRSAIAKHYALHGKVMSIDKLGRELIVDHDAIPGFMEAMTMPYEVSDGSMLARVSPGDEINADLKVQGDRIAIDQLTIVRKAPPGTLPVQTKAMHVPQTGEQAPDFELTNQNGKRIHLHDYSGKTLLVTFIYTRCTLNDFCPRMSGNFAEIDKALLNVPELYAKTHLLSISFDPEHDRPEVLRSYGAAYTERYTKENFKHWEFATAPKDELKKIADFFGVYYEKDGNSITHSLSTSIIGPDGTIQAWFPGNRWTPEEALAEVKLATASSGPARAANRPSSSTTLKPR